jgi:hypothetical protein
MTIQEQAAAANPAAIAKVTEALLRIFLADASGNNGLVNGESVLCGAHATEARMALEAAGIAIPEWVRR